jgi:hypothetical protein
MFETRSGLRKPLREPFKLRSSLPSHFGSRFLHGKMLAVMSEINEASHRNEAQDSGSAQLIGTTLTKSAGWCTARRRRPSSPLVF